MISQISSYGAEMQSNVTIDNVRKFWDEQPLFVDEGKHKPGTKEFFKEHKDVCIEDCFAGKINERNFIIPKDAKILDLGCGIGFWLVEIQQRGFDNLSGADISMNSLAIAKQRLEVHDIKNVLLFHENAESLTFDDGIFDHVNCQGVVHHTPNPKKAIQEIYRILSKNGTVTISVYYKNIILKKWSILKRIIGFLKPSLKGRGRENMYKYDSFEEIVRVYDGVKNPVGIAFTREEFTELLSPFSIIEVWYGFFPARSLNVKLPKFLHKFLQRILPFMIYARVKK